MERNSDVFTVLAAVEATTDPRDINAIRQLSSAIQLPILAIAPPRRFRSGVSNRTSDAPEEPRVVCVLSIDGALIDGPVRIRPGKIHALDVLVGVIDWPDGFDTLNVEFVGIWTAATIEARKLSFTKPEGDPAVPLAVEGRARVVLRVASDDPVSLTMQAEFSNLRVRGRRWPSSGYTSFEVRPFDPTLDAVTGREAIDERLHEIYAELRGKVPDEEFAAFSRLFSAVARAATAIQGDNVFVRTARSPRPTSRTRWKPGSKRTQRSKVELSGYRKQVGSLT